MSVKYIVKLKNILFIIFTMIAVFVLHGQEQNVNGVHDKYSPYICLKNAVIHVNGEKTIDGGMLLLKGERIEKVGKMFLIPSGAVIMDLNGKHIYPSFIELDSDYGMPKASSTHKGSSPQLNSTKTGAYHWNESIQPEKKASSLWEEDEKSKKELIHKGLGTVLTHQKDGIVRGTSSALFLSDKQDNENTLRISAAQHFSFKKGVSKQTYPSSQMGAIALIRQLFLDTEWYSQFKNPEKKNISYESFIKNQDLPQIFETTDHLEALRAAKIAKEFNKNFIIKGGGDEYKLMDEIKNSGSKFILPLNFQKAYDLKDPYHTEMMPLSQLKHWELAPGNPYFFYRSGVPFCLSTEGLKSADEVFKNIRKSMEYGLPEAEVLNSLTLYPAQFIGIEDEVGSLEAGKRANFIVTDHPVGDKKIHLLENWCLGQQIIVKQIPTNSLAGKYDLNINKINYDLHIKEKSPGKPEGIIYVVKKDSSKEADTTKIKVTIEQDERNVVLNLKLDDKNYKGSLQLHGIHTEKLGVIEGKGLSPENKWIDWVAIKSKSAGNQDDKKDDLKVDTSYVNSVWFPSMAYGHPERPTQKTYLIKNVKIWTNEEQGVIQRGSVLIRNGKISNVGAHAVSLPGDAVIIDAQGMHLTPGIIDEHSHIAISKGVNEAGQSITAEVRIGDVVRNNDINIYRQLAGGVTSAQLLHGSANAVGGQSALVKLRWGVAPEDMKIDSADGFIKFALGENVKQSNWGDKNTVRYPQTRMGVEQVYYDAFIRAKEYEDSLNRYEKVQKRQQDSTFLDKINPFKSKSIRPRRDLELDALLEILNDERFITCHSYIQSEINMLMKVADSMGFKINTFTHILEGYKLADKMQEHGAGGSTFSDWWAYKFEVNEAIPYNAALMQKVGVTVALNSDDAEMGRRLNQEAAKVIKYGGVTDEDALKMVTLNPAKLLHLDHRMGSIKEGKDADIVLWSSHPLGIDAKAEKTFVDGILYFDREQHWEVMERNRIEKARILNKMKKAISKGEKTVDFKPKKQHVYHCEDVNENDDTMHTNE